ncbi:MAG: cobalt ECF transporter T component CbiQ [Cyanobacteria bacterium P01_F01_bin.150]
MKIQFDDCTNLDSWVHQWDARFKVIGLVGLMMAFAAVKSLWLLPWMVLIVGLVYRLACLPMSFLQSRLRYPGFFLVGIVLFIPWLSGETPLWQWGPLTLWREGLLSSLLIAGRFLCSVTLGFIVLGTTPFLKLVKAFRALGVPALLTDMMLLSYRYLFEILANLDRMRRAMTLRGFRVLSSPQQVPQRSPQLSSTESSSLPIHIRSLTNQTMILATLAGTLFIRSYEQSERVYQAMRLRGYGYRPHSFTPKSNGQNLKPHILLSTYTWDAIALFCSLLVAISLLAANYWLSHGSTAMT